MLSYDKIIAIYQAPARTKIIAELFNVTIQDVMQIKNCSGKYQDAVQTYWVKLRRHYIENKPKKVVQY